MAPLLTRHFLFRILTKLRIGWIMVCLLALTIHVFRVLFVSPTFGYFLQSFINPLVDHSSRQTLSKDAMTSPTLVKQFLFHINITDNLGKIIHIELKNGHSKRIPDGFASIFIRVDDYQLPIIPFTNYNAVQAKLKRRETDDKAKFVYVLGFWEQISRSLISLLDLALLNLFTQRIVVLPRVRNSFMGSHGENLHFYVNISHLNKLLEESGVSGLIDEHEFFKQCGTYSREPNLTVHFLYKIHMNSYATGNFGQRKTVEIMKDLKGKTFVDCTRIGEAKKGNSEVCVNPVHLYETWFLENEIFRNAKCVVLSEWRGLGIDGSLRLNLQPSASLSHSLFIQYQLLFSDAILSEAKSFLKTFEGSFIAVHIRAERLLIPSFMAMKRLGTCLEILKETVAFMKSIDSNQNVFLLTDFGNYGSGTWLEKNSEEMMIIHRDLVNSLNATLYHPNSQSQPFSTDRGVVALVEMEIASSANHVVAVGRGTFQDWLVAKFLRNNHRRGSVFRICSKYAQLILSKLSREA